MSVVYIVFARFEQLSFYRREKFVRPLAERMKEITEKLDLEIAKLLSDLKNRSNEIAMSSTLKVFCFFLLAVFLILGTALYLFLAIMRKVFFNLLIGWRGLNLGSLSLMFSKFIGLVEQLMGVLHIPVDVVRIIFYPFQLICKLAELCDTGGLYKLLNVTCQGAKAPIELFLDSFVLGVAILFIKSDYNFLWAMTFQKMNRLTVVKYWIKGKEILSSKFVVAVIAFMITVTNPFITMLRFFLSFVNFGAFFENNHLTHLLSKACIGIEGFQNQELILVYSTSILVWWLIAPMLYSAAEIICPKGGYTASRTSLNMCFFGTPRPNSFLVTPLVEHGQVADEGGSASSSIGNALVTEQERDSNIGSIDSCSIVISDISELDVDGVQLSDYCNMNVDDNDIIIDMDSDKNRSSSIKDVHRRRSNKGSDLYSAFVSGESALLLLSEQENKKRDGSNDDHSILNENCHRREESRLHLIHDDCPISNSQPRSTQEVESTRDTTIESTSAGIYGIFRYACSMLSSVIGLDLLAVYVINTYVSYCQKLDKKEKMRQLRANRRWEFQTIQQTIERFQSERKKKRSWSQYLRLFYQYEIESRTADEALTKRWLKVANDSDDNKLPPYYRLCFMVQKRGALCKYSNCLHSSVHLRASIVFLRVLVYRPYVHRSRSQALVSCPPKVCYLLRRLCRILDGRDLRSV